MKTYTIGQQRLDVLYAETYARVGKSRQYVLHARKMLDDVKGLGLDLEREAEHELKVSLIQLLERLTLIEVVCALFGQKMKHRNELHELIAEIEKL